MVKVNFFFIFDPISSFFLILVYIFFNFDACKCEFMRIINKKFKILQGPKLDKHKTKMNKIFYRNQNKKKYHLTKTKIKKIKNSN